MTEGKTGRWGRLNNCNIVFRATPTVVRLVKCGGAGDVPWEF